MWNGVGINYRAILFSRILSTIPRGKKGILIPHPSQQYAQEYNNKNADAEAGFHRALYELHH